VALCARRHEQFLTCDRRVDKIRWKCFEPKYTCVACGGRHPIPFMPLWLCHIPFPPFRAASTRLKFNPGQIQRICVPNAPALFHTTRSSMQTTKALTTPSTWIDRLPPKVQPYLYLTRIDKPIGTLLLFYPCGTSLAAFRLFAPPVTSCTDHREVFSLTSLVDHNGLIRAQRTAIRPTEIHPPVWHRRAHHARGRMHNKRLMGPELGQRSRYVRT
jgi:hypothetical protein